MSMKNYYIGGVVVLLAMAWNRGNKAKVADETLSEGTDFSNATDWPGTAWDRISNADMGAAGYANLGGEVNAHPSKQTLDSLGLNVGWDGSLQ